MQQPSACRSLAAAHLHIHRRLPLLYARVVGKCTSDTPCRCALAVGTTFPLASSRSRLMGGMSNSITSSQPASMSGNRSKSPGLVRASCLQLPACACGEQRCWAGCKDFVPDISYADGSNADPYIADGSNAGIWCLKRQHNTSGRTFRLGTHALSAGTEHCWWSRFGAFQTLPPGNDEPKPTRIAKLDHTSTCSLRASHTLWRNDEWVCAPHLDYWRTLGQ